MQVQVIPGAVRQLYRRAEDLIPDDLREDGECDCDGPCCRSHVHDTGETSPCYGSAVESAVIERRVRQLRDFAKGTGIDLSEMPDERLAALVENLDCLTRSFEEMSADPLDLLIAREERALADAGSLADEVLQFVSSGGVTRA